MAIKITTMWMAIAITMTTMVAQARAASASSGTDCRKLWRASSPFLLPELPDEILKWYQELREQGRKCKSETGVRGISFESDDGRRAEMLT